PTIRAGRRVGLKPELRRKPLPPYIYVSAACAPLHTLRTGSRRWHSPCLMLSAVKAMAPSPCSREENRFAAPDPPQRVVRDDGVCRDGIARRYPVHGRNVRALASAFEHCEAVRHGIEARSAASPRGLRSATGGVRTKHDDARRARDRRRALRICEYVDAVRSRCS